MYAPTSSVGNHTVVGNANKTQPCSNVQHIDYAWTVPVGVRYVSDRSDSGRAYCNEHLVKSHNLIL